MPFELGPVVRFESRRVGRRKSWFVLRVLIALAVLSMLAVFHQAFLFNVRFGAPPDFAKRFLAATLVRFLAVLHLIIAFLIAPIEAASAFNRVRVRPMLANLLVTAMSPRRIVWETFAACLMPGIWLWLCLGPMAAIVISWWGVDPELIAIIEIVTIGSILVSVAIMVAVSLWSKQVFTALVGVYTLLGAWLLGSDFLWSAQVRPAWIDRANPSMLLVRQSNGSGPTTLTDAVTFAGGAALAAIVLLEITVVALPRVILGPAQARPRTITRFARLRQLALATPRWLPAPSIDENPVLWREWWRNRTTLGARVFWFLYFVAACAGTIPCVQSFWNGQTNPPDLVAVVGYEVGIGLLAVAVRSSLAWSDEKTAGREGLDLLLATPLPASTIVLGKWWGAYRDVLPIAFFPVVSAVVLAIGAGEPSAPRGLILAFVRVAVVVVILGQVLIYGAAFVSLGLILATRLTRPARSTFATVGLFVVLTLVLPTVTETAFLSANRDLAGGLGAGSPIAGPIAALMSLFFSPYFGRASYILPFSFAWLAVAGCCAWGLKWWTIHRFDRWMGRIPSTPDRSAPRKQPNEVAAARRLKDAR